MCSRERAVVYSHCKRMFDLSLRINRSIQEISALIDMISVEETRELLSEHINLMTSVASLRGSLNFESELFSIFPAPVLLDTNSLLRVTHTFEDENDAEFLQSSLMMMQVWASIDGMIYRPLAPPATIQETMNRVQFNGENTEESNTYASVRLQELSGMTIRIDDNTLRYRLQGNELCVNALVSNTYLLYVFNPLQYRPLDWTFDALLQIGDTRYKLPVQREGVYLNTTSYALRVFLSYGKLPDKSFNSNGNLASNLNPDSLAAVVSSVATEPPPTLSSREARGGDDCEPLGIPYDGKSEIFAFHLSATNRISKKTYTIASKATRVSLLPSALPSASILVPRSRDLSVASYSNWSNDDETIKAQEVANSHVTQSSSVLERHVHLPFDAIICYYFAPTFYLQYVEFAIGFEPLMHLLGITDFLSDAITAR